MRLVFNASSMKDIDKTMKRLKGFRNTLELSIRAHELIECAAPGCKEMFLPRTTGGHEKKYHSPTCGNRVRQSRFKHRLAS